MNILLNDKFGHLSITENFNSAEEYLPVAKERQSGKIERAFLKRNQDNGCPDLSLTVNIHIHDSCKCKKPVFMSVIMSNYYNESISRAIKLIIIAEIKDLELICLAAPCQRQ